MTTYSIWDDPAALRLVTTQAPARELRIVVSLEADEPTLLGTYVETDEAAVVYYTPDGRYKSAPEDCVTVAKVTL